MDAVEAGAEPRVSRAWIVTFADLLCLVLTFFVMLASMQKIDAARWAGVSESLSRNLDPDHTATTARPRAERNAALPSHRHAADLAYVSTLVDGLRRESAAFAGVQVQLGDDKLILTLPSSATGPVLGGLPALLG